MMENKERKLDHISEEGKALSILAGAYTAVFITLLMGIVMVITEL